MAIRMQHPLAEVERLFNRFEQEWSGGGMMPMDAFTKDDTLVLRFDLPGVSAEEIELTSEKNMLSVTVTRPVEETDDVVWSVRERPTGRHTRQVRVGDMVDLGKIEADYQNGVLTVTLPVREEVKPRKISITNREQPALSESS